MEKESSDIKQFRLEPPKNVRIKEPKPIRKKVITTMDHWTFECSDYEYEPQFAMIRELYENHETTNARCNLVLKEIQKKLSSYRSQDVIKDLYQQPLFVDIKTTISLLYESNLTCYYCREKVQVVYENVREPKQWSLDRIDNNHGHNRGNLLIACLTCNLRRGTMYHERYTFTKQMTIVKKTD